MRSSVQGAFCSATVVLWALNTAYITAVGNAGTYIQGGALES